MNKANIPEPDLDNLLQQTLKDDLPPEAETRMSRQFLRHKNALDRAEALPEIRGWQWMRGLFRKEILAVASAAMIILGLMMQLSGSQTALAYSIEKLKMIVTISDSVNRALFMDCIVQQPDSHGAPTTYRVRWRAAGEVRVDMNSAKGAQTLWISNGEVSVAGAGADVPSMPLSTLIPGPVWQPSLEFMTPKVLAKHLQEHYGLMQHMGKSSVETGEFRIIGREDQQDIEITVDAKTYLPKVLKKYSHDSDGTHGARICTAEVQFLWNQKVPADLFTPRNPVAKQ